MDDIDIHGDIVLPEKMIKNAIKAAVSHTADAVRLSGASDLPEQLSRIKKEVEVLHKARGYTLSQVSEIQLSADGKLS
jgi:ribosomal protein L4